MGLYRILIWPDTGYPAKNKLYFSKKNLIFSFFLFLYFLFNFLCFYIKKISRNCSQYLQFCVYCYRIPDIKGRISGYPEIRYNPSYNQLNLLVKYLLMYLYVDLQGMVKKEEEKLEKATRQASQLQVHTVVHICKVYNVCTCIHTHIL